MILFRLGAGSQRRLCLSCWDVSGQILLLNGTLLPQGPVAEILHFKINQHLQSLWESLGFGLLHQANLQESVAIFRGGDDGVTDFTPGKENGEEHFWVRGAESGPATAGACCPGSSSYAM